MEENVAGTNVLTEQETVWLNELQSMKDNGTLGAVTEAVSSLNEDIKQWAEEERLFDEEFTRIYGYSIYTGVPDDWFRLPPMSPEASLRHQFENTPRPRGDAFINAWPRNGTEKEQMDFMCEWSANKDKELQIEIRQMIKDEGLERLSREELQPYLQKWVDEGRFR